MSDTETALLAAIAADPRAETPRRVYADWLEETGRVGEAAICRAGGTAEVRSSPMLEFLELSHATATVVVTDDAVAPAVTQLVGRLVAGVGGLVTGDAVVHAERWQVTRVDVRVDVRVDARVGRPGCRVELVAVGSFRVIK